MREKGKRDTRSVSRDFFLYSCAEELELKPLIDGG